MNQIFAGMGAVALVLVMVTWVVWNLVRRRQILEQWAELNGFQLLSSSFCWFFRGPFFLTTSEGQAVYYVTVRDGNGVTRRGWVRVGGWWLGMLSDNAEVRWDK